MNEPARSPQLNIVVIGGGTGSFTLLNSLKHATSNITAIVNMADDGGSTGQLRDELGVLPPGDIRQCLVALSESPKVRDLFSYRFEEGALAGHALGNIFLTALEKLTGNFAEAVETASEVLRVKGKVVPATLDNVRLRMTWDQENIVLNGEKVIDTDEFLHDPRRATLSLEPAATANPDALSAIASADIVVIAPGDLYTSLGPILIAEGYQEALMQTQATIVYVCNLVTKKGQTDGFTVADHASEIERFIGSPVLDYVFYNKVKPEPELLEKYAREGEYWVEEGGDELSKQHYGVVCGEFLASSAAVTKSGDALAQHRTLIRHDADQITQELMKVSRD